MEQEIQKLIEISRYYGRQKDFVLAGGGNTSYKNDKYLWIKASGISLETIDGDGFAQLDRGLLHEAGKKAYPDDPLAREEEIRQELMKSRTEPEKGQRPSVESSLHNLLNFSFVVHTHPTKVNGLMCGAQAQEQTERLFGDKALFVEYNDPGHILFKVVEKKIAAYRQEKGMEPSVIFLQNHGVFVGADTIDGIKTLYEEIIGRLNSVYGAETPVTDIAVDAHAASIVPAVRMMVSGESLKIVRTVNNSLLNEFLKVQNHKSVALPFTPDGIVYAGSYFLHAVFDGDDSRLLGDLRKKIDDYRKVKGKYPNVIFIDGIGVLLVADNDREAGILEDVVNDVCRIARFASFFGGSQPMTPAAIAFIESWEAEQYRSKVSLGGTAGRADRKVVIVTGGAQGFGAGLAEHLMDNGANVVIADLSEEKGAELAASLNRTDRNNRALFVKTDVSNPLSVERLITETVVRFGGLDVFISNAGILRAGGLDEMTPETFRLMTAVNYEAYFLCAKYASEVMRLQHRFNGNHFMDIIQINSKSGLKGSNKNFAYAGGKFGGIGLTQSFALELMPYHIKVNAICPGNFYDGPLWADPEHGLFAQYLKAGKVPGAKTAADVKRYYEEQVPAGRGCTPQDVVRAVFYVMEQEYETGQAVPVTGGQNMLG